MRGNRVSSVGGFRNLPRHSSTRGWRYPLLLAFLILWRLPTSTLRVVTQYASSSARRLLHSFTPRPSRGAPVVPRSLRSRPRHGGRGQGRAVVGAIAPPLFFRLTPRVFTSAWPSYLRPRPQSGVIALLFVSGDDTRLRPLRPRFARPQPPFRHGAPALLVHRGRGPFKLTGLARQPRNNLKLSPRPRRTKQTHARPSENNRMDPSGTLIAALASVLTMV